MRSTPGDLRTCLVAFPRCDAAAGRPGRCEYFPCSGHFCMTPGQANNQSSSARSATRSATRATVEALEGGTTRTQGGRYERRKTNITCRGTGAAPRVRGASRCQESLKGQVWLRGDAIAVSQAKFCLSTAALQKNPPYFFTTCMYRNNIYLPLQVRRTTKCRLTHSELAKLGISQYRPSAVVSPHSLAAASTLILMSGCRFHCERSVRACQHDPSDQAIHCRDLTRRLSRQS